MTTILVTGAGGYIGSVATYLLLEKGYRVVGIDNFTTGYKTPLACMRKKFGKSKLSYYEADLHDDLSSILKRESGIDVVIHYAASCLVDESMKNPHKYFYNNTVGSLNFIEQLNKHNIRKIVFSSTCAVYGEAQKLPIDEMHPTNPKNPYGESKKMVEKLLDWYARTKGFSYVVLRYFNVCGASDDGVIGDSKKPSVLLVQNAVRGALGIEPFYLTCPTVDTPDKTPIRDYINVVDLNEAHINALEYLIHDGKPVTINLGTGTGNSVLEIVHAVQKETNVRFELQKTTSRKGEYAKMVADITRAHTVLNWSPKRSLQQSIHSLTLWYKDHPHGWES
ncbi:UDP-glucose 4-epimerase GalE [Candidatus Roizmanbacteria bacterium CG10_big_fil_rev_8_21_14_0_10_39_6]|uniref:UDP-glucose 4-epimerase n=1 Tax=Candidatus Roizmanbacteria bacterium CG10_big_fil_rev_8_21_14_0_10_39_6 TaxID=1974853 RepID=A0A2M8KTT2_9BACT|nr:MAG: UDP-glucose 4-epimerase GalE [Candidatus Roizmanbacteria bacterium CG10_big_fil_rev_8_21_14_0_10_39_6]